VSDLPNLLQVDTLWPWKCNIRSLKLTYPAICKNKGVTYYSLGKNHKVTNQRSKVTTRRYLYCPKGLRSGLVGCECFKICSKHICDPIALHPGRINPWELCTLSRLESPIGYSPEVAATWTWSIWSNALLSSPSTRIGTSYIQLCTANNASDCSKVKFAI